MVSANYEVWSLVADTKMMAPTTPQGLQLQNKFTDLKGEGTPKVFSSETPGQLVPNHTRPPGESNSWCLWVTPHCKVHRHPPASLICCLEKFAVCWCPESGMLWRDCQSLADPLIIVRCLFLPVDTSDTTRGNLKRLQKWLQSSGGDGQGYGDPDGIHLNPASEKGCKAKDSDRRICCRCGVGDRIFISLIMGSYLRSNSLLGRDGIHFFQQSKGIFVSGMAEQVRRALKQEWLGETRVFSTPARHRWTGLTSKGPAVMWIFKLLAPPWFGSTFPLPSLHNCSRWEADFAGEY